MSNVAAGSFIPPLPVYLPPDAEDGAGRIQTTLIETVFDSFQVAHKRLPT